jgi:hypothetical protein
LTLDRITKVFWLASWMNSPSGRSEEYQRHPSRFFSATYS